jgi:hypothetical protein
MILCYSSGFPCLPWWFSFCRRLFNTQQRLNRRIFNTQQSNIEGYLIVSRAKIEGFLILSRAIHSPVEGDLTF